MVSISATGIIAIALAASVVAVALLASFSHYLGDGDEGNISRDYPPEQERYMRQVRQRNLHMAYLESIGRGSLASLPTASGSWVAAWLVCASSLKGKMMTCDALWVGGYLEGNPAYENAVPARTPTRTIEWHGGTQRITKILLRAIIDWRLHDGRSLLTLEWERMGSRKRKETRSSSFLPPSIPITTSLYPSNIPRLCNTFWRSMRKGKWEIDLFSIYRLLDSICCILRFPSGGIWVGLDEIGQNWLDQETCLLFSFCPFYESWLAVCISENYPNTMYCIETLSIRQKYYVLYIEKWLTVKPWRIPCSKEKV